MLYSKELKPKDLVEPPDSYHATGLTGSRRYMAPEVVLCKNYGFAADVYSYSIVIWELFSGKMAYEDMDFNSHFEDVVTKEKRPSTKLYGIPKTLIKLMQMGWDPDPLRRVDFKYIRQILKHESKLLNRDHIENGHQHHLSNRTDYLSKSRGTKGCDFRVAVSLPRSISSFLRKTVRQSARSQTNEMIHVNEESEQTQPTSNNPK
jgi:serine/threonine protein kinase